MKSKKWYQHDRYVESLVGSSIAAIASITAVAWSIWKLGVSDGAAIEAEYISDLMHDELGDDWEEHRVNVNKKIDENFEKHINK